MCSITFNSYQVQYFVKYYVILFSLSSCEVLLLIIIVILYDIMVNIGQYYLHYQVQYYILCFRITASITFRVTANRKCHSLSIKMYFSLVFVLPILLLFY